MATVLVIDDEPAVRFTLGELCESWGHEALCVSSAEEALALFDRADVVLTDLSLPGMDGLALLQRARAHDEALPVVLVTARGSERVAVAAMKAGAHDYVAKPFDFDELAAVVSRALEARALRTEAKRARAERSLGRVIVGEAPAFRRVLDAASRLADREVPVLVRGETGTGKELVAELLHAQGRRAKGPLVRVNCAAIAPELAEAELFGHARGAFTGAVGAREGLVARAHGGTLVLDEVGELPLGLQAKLLRAVQQGEVQPVGAAKVERVDVRWVASTHRDLRAEARAGRFREDLYYRLAVVELVVPPLRERAEDVPALARSFAQQYARRFGITSVSLDDELVRALSARPWPGNVRELENAVARMVALAEGPRLERSALAWLDPSGESQGGAPDAPDESDDGEAPEGLRGRVASYERTLLARAMASAGGNQSAAARALGLSRGTLIEKLKRHGL